jgi:DNA-binding MarR family transcriptional regulator
MEQMLELFLKHGLRPLSLFSETKGLEKEVTRSELSALLILHFRNEMTMSNLSTDLGAPLSTITSLTKRLVRKGLIERNQSTKDQRIILIRLTAKGKQLALQAKAIMENIFSRVQATLSTDELEQFLALALKIGRALQNNESKETVIEDQKLRKITIDD